MTKRSCLILNNRAVDLAKVYIHGCYDINNVVPQIAELKLVNNWLLQATYPYHLGGLA